MHKHEGINLPEHQSAPLNGYPSYHQHTAPHADALRESGLGEYSDAIERISNLVDRYWNGSKSLIGNLKFRGMLV